MTSSYKLTSLIVIASGVHQNYIPWQRPYLQGAMWMWNEHYSIGLITIVLYTSIISTYQWYALPPIPRAQWKIGGELTCPNETSPHTWSTILHTIPLMNTPYTYPCCGQCVTGRYGCLDVTILPRYPPTANPPPFSNICPRYARWGIPLIGA